MKKSKKYETLPLEEDIGWPILYENIRNFDIKLAQENIWDMVDVSITFMTEELEDKTMKTNISSQLEAAYSNLTWLDFGI